jgi:transmembrane sensor
VSEVEKVIMGSDTDNNLQTRAIEWHVRLRHGDDAAWDAFADWLAQDLRHREAYEAIEQTDLAIDPLLRHVVFPETAHDAVKSTGTPVPESPPRSLPRSLPPSRRWRLAGGVLAASIAVVVAFLPQLASSRYEVTTGPGQRQTVALDATTQVMLNGSTRMTFDRKNPRFASLASGEALFRVHHDDAKPFTLEVANNRIQDVGTVFNVVRDSSQVRVAVAEGKVIYSTQAQAVPLDAGQALLARSDSATVRVTTTPITSVGAWQNGRLVYSGEPLSQVAADLGRSLGVNIVVSPTIVDRPFSGAIVLDGAGPEQLKRLKLALNVDLEAGPTGWTMKPVDDGGR